ncbi:MAG: DMT family transporter [Acetivibrio sp.]
MWGFILAMISGALMSIQGVFNTGVTKETSIWISAGFVQFSACLVCVAAWFITGKESHVLDLLQVSHKYMLLGGVMGAFITFTVIQSIGALGPAKSAIFIVVTQLFVSYLMELFGLFGIEKVNFEWRKLIGLGIIIVGVFTFKWK